MGKAEKLVGKNWPKGAEKISGGERIR